MRVGISIALLTSGLIASTAQAAPISYTTLDEVKTENFTFAAGNARIVAWNDGVTFAGWTAYLSGGSSFSAGAPSTLNISTGAASPDALYLYRASTTTTNHRLFTRNYNGNSAASTGYISHGWSITNDSGSTLTSFDFGYTGFVGSISTPPTSGQESLVVQYAINATNVSNAGGVWTSIGDLLYAPSTENSSTVFAPVTTAISLAPGETLTIRFVDGNNFNIDANLMIDDVSFSATGVTVPEPASLGLIGIAALAMLKRRRAM